MVETSFTNGELRIVGDEEANVFEVAADSDGTLVITPDRDTALNELNRGEPLRMDADRLNHVFILPGEGNDVVRVRGLNIPGGLHVEDKGHGNPVDIKASRMAIEKIEIAVEKVERPMRVAGGNDGDHCLASRYEGGPARA